MRAWPSRNVTPSSVRDCTSKIRSMSLPSMTVARALALLAANPFVSTVSGSEVTSRSPVSGGVLTGARPGEHVALTGAQQDRRWHAAGVGGDHGLAQGAVLLLAAVGHRVVGAGRAVGDWQRRRRPSPAARPQPGSPPAVRWSGASSKASSGVSLGSSVALTPELAPQSVPAEVRADLRGSHGKHARSDYFAAIDRRHGEELWRSNGTRKGTRMVRDIRRGTVSSDPPKPHSCRQHPLLHGHRRQTRRGALEGRTKAVHDGQGKCKKG